MVKQAQKVLWPISMDFYKCAIHLTAVIKKAMRLSPQVQASISPSTEAIATVILALQGCYGSRIH